MARKVNVTEERIELTAIDKASAVYRQTAGAVKDLRSSIDTVKNALAAVGVTVGAGAMLSLYMDVLKANAALDDMSESTGSSAENLSRLQQVAKIGGHDFDGLTGTIGKMIKGLKGADEEGQAAAHALKFLGVEAKDSIGRFRDTGEILTDVAKKLKQYEDGGNKTALVQDLLGKGAERYLPFLKDLAEETGVHAKLTAEQARQAEQAEKNINRLKIAMEDARREIVIGITPAISEFIEKLLKAQQATGGWIAGLAAMAGARGLSGPDIDARIQEIDAQLDLHQKQARIAEKLGSFGGIGGLMSKLGGIGGGIDVGRLMAEREYLQKLRPAPGPGMGLADWMEPGPATSLAYTSPKKGGTSLSPYESAVLQQRQAAAKAEMGDSEFISTQLEIQAGKYKELTAAQKEHLLTLAAQRDVQKSLAEQRKEFIDGQETAAKAVAAYNEQLRLSAERYLDLVDPAREYFREQDHLNELLRHGTITQEEYWAIQNRLVETRGTIIKLGEASSDAAAAAQSLGLSFTSSMDRIMDGSMRGVKAMDVLKAAALDVLKVLYAKNITAPASKALERAFAGAFGAGGGMDAGGDAFNQGMFYHGGGIAGVEGRRAYVHPAYFERAPRYHQGLMPDEVPAVLKKGEGVFTPAQMRALGGGRPSVTVIQHNSFGAGVSRAELLPLLEQHRQLTKAAVDRSLRNGGDSARAAGLV